MSSAVDGKFYQVIRPGSLSERLLMRARANIYADFMEYMAPDGRSRILDVGVSDVINDGANVLEREYPHQERITACGIGEGHEFKVAFPECTYHKIVPNEPLPFEDGSFPIATANAVLEHVGSVEKQIFFISQLCRVAKKVFISVPHRYFPVEHHTSIPLLHYSDMTFGVACRLLKKDEWAEEDNLILMTKRHLRFLAESSSRRVTVGHTGIRLGPMSSNLFLVLQ